MKMVSPFLSIIVFVVLGYGLFVILLYFFQSKLVYFPDHSIQFTPDEFGFTYTEHFITTRDEVSLHSWYIPALKPRATVLFCHGNAGNISHRLESIAVFHQLNLNVFIFDYRGYGLSNGITDEDGTYFDAQAAWDFLCSEKNEHPSRIIIFGRSLGSAVAARLAGRVDCAAVLLESSFISLPQLGAELYPFLPVRLLAKNKYPTGDYVRQIQNPVLFIHSRNDEIIPFRHGQSNFQNANEPKFFLEIRGSHNNGFLVSGVTYTSGIRQFIDPILQE